MRFLSRLLTLFMISGLYAGSSPLRSTITWNRDTATIRFTNLMSDLGTIADSTAAPGEVPFSITRGPFFFRLSDTVAILGWETAGLKTIVRNPDGTILGMTRDTPYRRYSADLTGLSPNTPYYYRLESSGAGWSYQSSCGTFRTRPAFNVRVEWKGILAVIRWDEPLADPAAPSGTPPFSIMTGPWLGELSDSVASIGWEVAALAGPGKVVTLADGFTAFNKSYRDKLELDSLCNFDFRKIRLNDLLPGTKYRYMLVSGSGGAMFVSDTFEFTTHPRALAVPEPFKFAVLGDTRGKTALTDRNLGNLMEWRPQLFMNNGDIISVANSGSYSGGSLDAKLAWMEILSITRAINPGANQIWTLGNWDINAGDGKLGLHEMVEDYAHHFRITLNAVGRSYPPYYYSTDGPDVHIVTLCTQVAGASDTSYNGWTENQMVAWLEEDLRNTKAQWKIVTFHDPDYLLTRTGRGSETVGSILSRHGVQLVLKASHHIYQVEARHSFDDRGIMRKNDSGFVEVTSGGGGHRALNPAETYGIYYREGGNCPVCMGDDVVRAYQIIHHVRVEAAPDEIRLYALDTGKTVFDAFRLPQFGQPELLPSANGEKVNPAGLRPQEEAVVIAPNPHNPAGRLSYRPDYPQNVRITLFDPLGRKVRDQLVNRKAGWHSENLNLAGQASGMYIVKVRVNGRQIMKQLTLLK